MRVPSWGAHRGQLLRAGVGTLAVIDALVGGWALVFPASFYLDFPGLGMHWITAVPPYNEHLLTDFGSALVGIAVALGVAAIVAERRVMQVVLLAALVQAVLHLGYHLFHPDMLPTGQEVASRVVLAVPGVVALGLLWLTRRADDRVPRTLKEIPV